MIPPKSTKKVNMGSVDVNRMRTRLEPREGEHLNGGWEVNPTIERRRGLLSRPWQFPVYLLVQGLSEGEARGCSSS